jgi:hypothetical protein
MSIVYEYPDPNHLPPNSWLGDEIDDDVVVSHGDTLLKDGRRSHGSSPAGAGFIFDPTHKLRNRVFMFGTLLTCCFAIWHAFLRGRRTRKGYTELGQISQLTV